MEVPGIFSDGEWLVQVWQPNREFQTPEAAMFEAGKSAPLCLRKLLAVLEGSFQPEGNPKGPPALSRVAGEDSV